MPTTFRGTAAGGAGGTVSFESRAQKCGTSARAAGAAREAATRLGASGFVRGCMGNVFAANL
jgi:hypothetical protein